MNKKFIQQITCSLTFFFIVCCGIPTLEAATPEARVTLHLKGAPLEQIMNEIETQTRYLFIVDQGVKTDRRLDIEVRNKPLADVLRGLFSDTDVAYKINAKNILLSLRPGLDATPARITGVVVDAQGKPVGRWVKRQERWKENSSSRISVKKPCVQPQKRRLHSLTASNTKTEVKSLAMKPVRGKSTNYSLATKLLPIA